MAATRLAFCCVGFVDAKVANGRSRQIERLENEQNEQSKRLSGRQGLPEFSIVFSYRLAILRNSLSQRAVGLAALNGLAFENQTNRQSHLTPTRPWAATLRDIHQTCGAAIYQAFQVRASAVPELGPAGRLCLGRVAAGLARRCRAT